MPQSSDDLWGLLVVSGWITAHVQASIGEHNITGRQCKGSIQSIYTAAASVQTVCKHLGHATDSLCRISLYLCINYTHTTNN